MKNKYISNLRIVSIILVVLAHSIIIYNPYWGLYTTNNNSIILKYLCLFIYIFHMPLFFSISGFLFNNTLKHNYTFKQLFKKKFLRLIVPYLIVGIIWLIPIKTFLSYSNYTNNSFIYNVFVNLLLGIDNGHLWFLPALFLIFLFSYCIEKLCERYQINIYLRIIILVFLSGVGHILPIYIGSSFIYLLWFQLGKMIASGDIKISNSKYKFLLLIIMVVLIPIYLIIYDTNSIFKYVSIVLQIIICFIMLLLIYGSKIVIFKSERKYNIFNIIDKNSFGIYLFHSPLIYFSFTYYPNINPILMVIINFLIFGIFSVFITILIRKIKLGFIIGEYNE